MLKPFLGPVGVPWSSFLPFRHRRAPNTGITATGGGWCGKSPKQISGQTGPSPCARTLLGERRHECRRSRNLAWWWSGRITSG